MNTENYPWDKFSLTFYYPVPREKLFTAWSTAKGLESFFIEEASFINEEGLSRAADERIQASDRYEWKWRHDFAVNGQIQSLIGNEELSFSFGSMNVRLRFFDSDQGSGVHLEQSDIPDNPDGLVMGHLNCRSCWTFFMTNLKSVLINGTDLRDQDPTTVSSMEVGYVPKELTMEG